MGNRVKRTYNLLIGTQTADEIVARIMEKAFYYLEAPIARVTGFDLVSPLFSREKAYLPNAQRIMRAAKRVLKNE